MDMTQLKYFQTVATTEHLTRASEMLYISQPSLSKAISRLESELGVNLFDREGNKIRLNSFGRVFLERVNNTLGALDGACTEVKEMAGLEHGHISVASGYHDLLNPITLDFLDRYPDTFINEALMSEPEMAEALEKLDIDFAVMTDVLSIPGVQWMPLMDLGLYVYVSLNHRLAGRGTVSLSELNNERFATHGMGFRIPPSVERTIKAIGFNPRFIYSGSEKTTVGSLVDEGNAVSFITSFEYQSMLYQFGEFPGVSILKLVEPEINWSLGIASKRGHFLSAAAESFQRMLTDYLKRLNMEMRGELPLSELWNAGLNPRLRRGTQSGENGGHTASR